MDLDSYKYVELQRLAKEVGLKANMKADKLLKSLKQHFSQQQQASENGNDAPNADALVDAQGSHTAAFVTERRGKSRTVKRKLCDSTPVTAENDEKPVETEENRRGSEENRRGSKRRKVSSSKDTSIPPEIPTDKDALEENREAGETNSDARIQPSGKGAGRKTAGRIPRHEGLMKKPPALRPTTPNFKKLHEAHFKKMESIDSYVQRKNKQMEVIRNSVKELKTLSEKTLMKSVETKKAPVSRASLFSPGVQDKNSISERRRLTKLSGSKLALKDSTTFRPTVLTTNKINVRFSQATQDNEYKRSLVKTPARMSPLVPVTSTPGRKSNVRSKSELNKSTAQINKTPGVTPFVFSGDNSMSVTPGTTKKSTFDLKASLSRPLTYKPHKGKLKPFGDTQENLALNKSQTVPSHQKNYKQHQVQTREERRVRQVEDRKQKKEMMMGARRGLVMA